MIKQREPLDRQSMLCEVCLKPAPKSEAVTGEEAGHIVYFCSASCYDVWRNAPAPESPEVEIQEGRSLSRSRDDYLKRTVKQHPQRDEPRADSVEPEDLPPA